MNNQIQVELQEVMGSDRSIAEAAWTSSTTYQGKNKRTTEDVKRVVNMLADLKHSTPFESIVFRFWIKLPIAADRQFMTHRLQSTSGMSGRYRTMPDEYLHMQQDIKDILLKLIFNIPGLSKRHNMGYEYIEKYQSLCEETNNAYQNLVEYLKTAEKDNLITNKELKRAREFYRGILPQHNMTERVSIMNLRAFANFIKLRNSEHAQPEIREVAQKMLEAVEKVSTVPAAIAALKRNNWSI